MAGEVDPSHEFFDDSDNHGDDEDLPAEIRELLGGDVRSRKFFGDLDAVAAEVRELEQEQKGEKDDHSDSDAIIADADKEGEEDDDSDLDALIAEGSGMSVGEFRAMWRKQEEGATKIQSLIRGRIVRKQLKSLCGL